MGTENGKTEEQVGENKKEEEKKNNEQGKETRRGRSGG